MVPVRGPSGSAGPEHERAVLGDRDTGAERSAGACQHTREPAGVLP